jgi:hypothetical protein
VEENIDYMKIEIEKMSVGETEIVLNNLAAQVIGLKEISYLKDSLIKTLKEENKRLKKENETLKKLQKVSDNIIETQKKALDLLGV